MISRPEPAAAMRISRADSASMRTVLHGQDAARRERIARAFAARAGEVAGVREIRLSAVDDGLAVTVLTDDRDMQRDLLLHSAFTADTSELDDVATLRILVYQLESAPDAGTLLH